MSSRDVVVELTSELRAQLEAATAGEAFDADSALAKLRRIEQTTELLRRVSLHSIGEFENRVHELSLLCRIGEIFVSVFDLERVSLALLEVVVEALPCENGFLYLSDPANQLELKATSGPEASALELETAESVGSLAASTSEPTCVPDIAADSRFPSGAHPESGRSYIACPMKAVNESLGVIVLSENGRAAFSPDHARTLRPIADFAALAIRHARVCAKNLQSQASLEALVEERTREVNAARAALSRHERTAAMGKLAASIAHEVNNPMSYLVSNMEQAGEYIDDIEGSVPLLLELQESALQLPNSRSEKVRRTKSLAQRALEAQAAERLSLVTSDFGALISEAREGVDRIQRVGNDLRGFAHGITGVMETADLNRLVETALHIAKAEAKERIRFECALGVLPDVRCQQYQITQVLLNLLKNAVEAIEGEGEVRISTRVVDRWAEVEIADEGPGIPPDRIERIFEPFLTTKLTGSGLGLSISRDIVNQHRGSLDVQSSPGGSVFTLRLAVAGPGCAELQPD